MANPIGEAFITLRPDLSKFSGEAGSAMTASLQKMGGALTTIGRTMTVGLTAPIVAGLALATKGASDFETAVVGMTNKISGTPQQIQAIVDGARQMSKEMPISAVALLDIAKNAGQLGVATDDVLSFTKTVAQMAQISDMSADAIASGMAKIANVMGVSGAETFQKMGNTIAAMGKIGASTEDQIIEMAQRIAGAGRVVGLSTADVLAFANALATVGIDAEAGGTAISRLFIEMANAASGLKPTEEQLQAIAEAQNAVRDSGYALESANRAVRDANEAVADSHRGVRDAAEGIQQANLDLADAYQELGFAQTRQAMASFDSRKEFLSIAQAQQHLMEVQSKFPAQALQMKEAQLAVAEATERLNEARKKGNAREVQRAELSLSQAIQRQNELMVSQRGYALDVASAQNNVIDAQRREGTAATNAAKDVQSANKKVQDSIKAKKDAQDKYTDALKTQRNAEEARLDAQRNVVRANEAYFASQKKAADIIEATTGKLGIFAKVAGVSAEQFAAKFKGDAAGATTDFIEGIQRLSKEGVNVFPILQKLGLDDARLQRSILGLAGMTGAENDLRAMLSKAAAEWDHGNELQRQSAAINETNAAKWQIFKNQIQDAANVFGQQILPMLKDFMRDSQPVIAAVQGLAQSFSNLSPGMQKAIVIFALAVAAIGPLLIIIGQLMIAFAAFTVVTGGVTIALGPILIAILVLTAAVLAAYLVWKHWDEIKTIVSGAAGVIIGAFNSILDFLKTNWKTVAVLISGPFLPLVILATDAFGIRSALVDAFNAVLNFVRDNWKEIATLISGPFAAVVALATDAFGIRTAIINAFSSAATWLYNAGKAIVVGLINGITAKLGDLQKLLGRITDLLPDWKGPAEKDRAILEPTGRMIMEGLSNGMRAGFGPVQDQLGGYTDSLSAWKAPSLGRSGGEGLRAMTGSGGGGGGAQMAAIGSGVTVNNYGPINAKGMRASSALKNVGWGVGVELQRRGVYA